MKEPPPLPESRWCSRCGASIQPAANFCHACGAAVPKSVQTLQGLANKPPGSRPKNRSPLQKLLMLGFIGFVVYAVYDTVKRQSAQQTNILVAPTPEPESQSWERLMAELKARNAAFPKAISQPSTPTSSTIGPVIVGASNADNSVDPASVTYTVRDRNIFGRPTEVVIPSQFATDAGLIAVARRLAKDNAKYRRAGMPVQIYGSDDTTRELAEYWNVEDVHDLRMTGSDGFVRKIVKFPVSKTVDRELTSKERRAIDAEANKVAAEVYKALTSGITLANYNRLRTGMTYSEVVKILGRDGVDISSSDIGGFQTVMYQWQGDGIGNMNAMFQNGKLVQKAQFGLK